MCSVHTVCCMFIFKTVFFLFRNPSVGPQMAPRTYNQMFMHHADMRACMCALVCA